MSCFRNLVSTSFEWSDHKWSTLPFRLGIKCILPSHMFRFCSNSSLYFFMLNVVLNVMYRTNDEWLLFKGTGLRTNEKDVNENYNLIIWSMNTFLLTYPITIVRELRSGALQYIAIINLSQMYIFWYTHCNCLQ